MNQVNLCNLEWMLFRMNITPYNALPSPRLHIPDFLKKKKLSLINMLNLVLSFFESPKILQSNYYKTEVTTYLSSLFSECNHER